MTRRVLPLPFVCLVVAGCPAPKNDPAESIGAGSEDTGEEESSDTGEVSMTGATSTTGAPTPPEEESSTGEDMTGPEITTNSFLGDIGNDVNVECSVWDQDCMPGEKCMPWSNNGEPTWNATKCVPISPDPGQPGDPCTVEGSGTSGVDDCDVSAMCWNVSPEDNMGTCISFCSGSEASPLCDDPSQTCSITNEGVLILCLPNCDPLIQDCDEGEACYGIIDGYVCAPDVSGEMGAFADPCEAINVCDPGLECVGAAGVPDCGSAACCTEFCDLSNPMADADCAGAGGGQMCAAAFEMGSAPPGYENVGYCLIPS